MYLTKVAHHRQESARQAGDAQPGELDPLERRVAFMLSEWDGSDELYGEFARRLVRLFRRWDRSQSNAG